MTATHVELELLGDVQVESYDRFCDEIDSGRAVAIGIRSDGAYTWAVLDAA